MSVFFPFGLLYSQLSCTSDLNWNEEQSANQNFFPLKVSILPDIEDIITKF